MPHATDTTRAAFEQWYAENAFDYARHPVGSRDFGLQWTAWLAGAAAERERCLHWCRLGDHEGYATHHIENGDSEAFMTPLPNSMYKALLDRLDGLVPADHRAWTEANGFVPLTPALLARIDALVGGVEVSLDAPIDPKDA